MATPRRRLSTTTPRNTLMPRRDPTRPGMGGTNPLPPRRRPPIATELRSMGFDTPSGFGFTPEQQQILSPELAMIQQALAGRTSGEGPGVPFHWNPNQGIAGNLGVYEQRLGIDPHRITPLGASQDQRMQFAQAFGYQPPPPPPPHQGGPPQGPPQPGNQGQFGPPPPPPGGGHQGPQVPQQPGNQGQFGPPPPPPGGGHQGPHVPQQQQGPPQQQQSQVPPQGPYAQWSPGAPLQLPGFQQFAQGYYNELPQAPAYLTGEGVAAQQAYMNALRNQLAGIQGQYGQIAPQVNQQEQRLATDYGQQRQQLASGYAGNGIFNSGIAATGFQNQVGDFNRQEQDLLSAAQQQVSGLYGQAGSVFGDTSAALLDLYRQQAGQVATDPYAPYGAPAPVQRRRL